MDMNSWAWADMPIIPALGVRVEKEDHWGSWATPSSVADPVLGNMVENDNRTPKGHLWPLRTCTGAVPEHIATQACTIHTAHWSQVLASCSFLRTNDIPQKRHTYKPHVSYARQWEDDGPVFVTSSMKEEQCYNWRSSGLDSTGVPSQMCPVKTQLHSLQGILKHKVCHSVLILTKLKGTYCILEHLTIVHLLKLATLKLILPAVMRATLPLKTIIVRKKIT